MLSVEYTTQDVCLSFTGSHIRIQLHYDLSGKSSEANYNGVIDDIIIGDHFETMTDIIMIMKFIYAFQIHYNILTVQYTVHRIYFTRTKTHINLQYCA